MTRLKIGTLMGPFNPKYELKYELKRKSMSLKFTDLKRKSISLKFIGELSVMTMKTDAKFEEKLTCGFKIDMNNLIKFYAST